MELKLTPWDVSAQLQTREDAILFLQACLDEAPHDLAVLTLALKSVVSSAAFRQFKHDDPLRLEVLRMTTEACYSDIRHLAGQLGIPVTLENNPSGKLSAR